MNETKVVWNIFKYGYKKFFTLVDLLLVTLYTEELSCFSSAAGHGANILGHAGMTVTSEGAVMWSPSAHLEVWCNLNLDQWPNDIHTCELQLGLWSQTQFVELLLAENETVVSYFSHYIYILYMFQ